MDHELSTRLLEEVDAVDDAFLSTHRTELLEALGAVPGMDAVRAIVLRVFDRLAPTGEERDKHLQAAAGALRTFPDAVTSGDPMVLMSRHPSWVGLAHLELCDRLDGDAEAALSVATEHARLGFSAAAKGAVQDGETLWALGETAEEAGWEARASDLYERALLAPFADADHRDQVALLLATRIAGTEPARAADLLEPVVGGTAPAPVRIQAAFVRSRIAWAADAFGEARRWLEQAVQMADEAGDEQVARTLRGELHQMAEG